MDRALHEVHELHRFFEAWLAGRGPSNADHYARLEKSLAPGFSIISPNGKEMGRDELIQLLQGSFGERGEGFRLWVHALRGHEIAPGIVLVTYEEWQSISGHDRSRKSSAILRCDPEPEGACVWLHVHETWLP